MQDVYTPPTPLPVHFHLSLKDVLCSPHSLTPICVLDVSPLPGMDCPHCLQGLVPLPTFWSFPVLTLVGFSLHCWPHCGTLPCPVWSWGYRDSGKAPFLLLKLGSIPLESECICKG